MTKRRVYWLIWLLTVLGLYFFENNTETRIVLTASIMIPLVSAACAAFCASRVRFSLDVPDELWKNEPGKGSCMLSGTAVLSACALSAKLCVTNLLTGETAENLLDFEGTDPVRFTLSGERCGALEVGLAETAVSDWFGLWRFPVSNTEQKTVTVRPDHYPVQITASDRPGIRYADLREQLLKSSSDSSVYGEIREYVPGDPVRQIHWKLSEKTDKVLIREQAHSSEKNIRLLLKLFGSKVLPERINETVEAMLSASLALSGEGYAHEVCLPDTDNNGWTVAEVASEQEFRTMQDAVLSLRREDVRDLPEIQLSGPLDERVLIFDASSDALCCSREEPGLEL